MSDAQIIDLFRKNLCGKYYFGSMDSQFKINITLQMYMCAYKYQGYIISKS